MSLPSDSTSSRRSLGRLKGYRDQIIDLLNDYQTLVESQAEDIQFLKSENARLNSLIDTEIKYLAVEVRKIGGLVQKPISQGLEPVVPPIRTYGQTTCKKCGERFERLRAGGKLCERCKGIGREIAIKKMTEGRVKAARELQESRERRRRQGMGPRVAVKEESGENHQAERRDHPTPTQNRDPDTE